VCDCSENKMEICSPSKDSKGAILALKGLIGWFSFVYLGFDSDHEAIVHGFDKKIRKILLSDFGIEISMASRKLEKQLAGLTPNAQSAFACAGLAIWEEYHNKEEYLSAFITAPVIDLAQIGQASRLAEILLWKEIVTLNGESARNMILARLAQIGDESIIPILEQAKAETYLSLVAFEPISVVAGQMRIEAKNDAAEHSRQAFERTIQKIYSRGQK